MLIYTTVPVYRVPQEKMVCLVYLGRKVTRGRVGLEAPQDPLDCQGQE